MIENPIIEIGSGSEIPPGSNLGNIREDFNRLEKNQDKANTFMMWMTGIIAGVFFVTGIMIAFDYWNNNEERYEKFINETENFYSKDEMEKNFVTRSEIYSKDDLKSLLIENTRNTNILECLKIRQTFSVRCFDQ